MAVSKGYEIKSLAYDSGVVNIASNTRTIVNSGLKSLGLTTNKDIAVFNPVYINESSQTNSQYLLRSIKVIISNPIGDSFILNRCKITVTGSKYIGVQQDTFNIKMYNLDLGALATSINNGYILVRVVIGNEVVFAGTIKNVNTGIEGIVNNGIELICLSKVTDLISDMVSPITVNSSMNIWSVLASMNINVNYPLELKDMKFDKEYTFSGATKHTIEDIMKIINKQINRTNIKDLKWMDYTLEQEGIINIFSNNTGKKEVLRVAPHTGMLDAPIAKGDQINVNSVYRHKIVPGRILFIENKYFSTLGNDSAFVWAWDRNGLYVTTEVRYNFSNYPNTFRCSIVARPLEKYGSYVAGL